MEQQPTKRNHAIDALRVSAFGLLMLYHLGMGYVSDWGWHIKSTYLTDALHLPMLWSNQWRMSLLFVISGFALAAMTRTNRLPAIAHHRIKTLGLPLIAGIFIWVVPQVYVELATKGQLNGMGAIDFLVHYWAPYLSLPEGYGRLLPTTWTWNHLWFLPYVLSYCLLYLSILWLVRKLFAIYRQRKSSAIGYASNSSRERFMMIELIALLALPCIGYWVIGVYLHDRYPTTHAFYNDWFNHASYFLSFLIGIYLALRPHITSNTGRYWHLLLALACINFLLVLCLYTKFALTELDNHLQGLIWSSNRWLWQLTVVALAMRFLHAPFHWVALFKPRIFCYYIFHQTWLVLAIYVLNPFQLGVIEVFCVMLMTVIGCEVCYQLGSRFGRFSGALGVYKARGH